MAKKDCVYDQSETDPGQLAERPFMALYIGRMAAGISIAPFSDPEMSYAFAGAIKVHDKERLELEDTSIFGEFGSQRRL